MIQCKRLKNAKKNDTLDCTLAPETAAPPVVVAVAPPPAAISKGDIVKLVKGRIMKAKHINPSGNGMMEA